MRVDTRKVPETPLMVCDVQASVGGAYRVAVSRGDKLTCQCKGLAVSARVSTYQGK